MRRSKAAEARNTMRPPPPREELDAWLRANGWYPGRGSEPENTAEAERLIAVRVRGSAGQGFPLEPWDEVRRFVSSYVGLEFPMPLAPERRFRADPTFGYEGDAELVVELARNVGQRLFPVGWETSENGIVLLDDTGRFFYLHHTGPYFLGGDEIQALSSLMTGDQEDAEDHFV
ncbi:SUKH-3 domain-containing protein [Streptomyces sp. 5-8]|uniref:SUKH-3 domain-containing protein n=2 Tax=Streptomyces TaxID=1883 RepID=A0ABS1P6Z7_9ACTN|nr:SUKH-3 domain-containing protein [Streptomyces musisoli]MBL1107845.1 SUKH-3 domain-containing protein [Streptomyces musisoli]